jgi:hypothetical protein
MKKYIISMMLLAAAVHLPAQTNTLQRRYVPIVIKGVQLPLASFNSSEWRAFKYQAGKWQLVPFQAEGVASDGKYNRAWSGIVDSNDELIFMTQDLGDKAQALWYDDPAGRSATRLELEFFEQLDPAKKGWIYLYKSTQTPTGYQSHIDGPTGTAADTVVTPYFKLGHNKDGWLDYISLSSYPGVDLLDRLKLRLAGKTPDLIGLGNYAVIEDTLNEGAYTYWPWLIRTHRDQRSKLSIPQLLINNVSIDYGLTYFPYSMTLGVEGAQINPSYLALAGGKTLRQSIDLAPAAAGMKFYSENNRGGVTIDGQADAIDAALAIQTGLHWAMASGQQGTLFLIMEMPGVKGGTTKLYYRDSQSGGTNDGTPESGDSKSFGDMGLWAQANSNSSLSMSQITMGFTMYMLPERNRDAVFADSLFTWVKQPLAVSVVEQIAPATGVTRNESQPTSFAISSAWPNPVTTADGSVQFRVTSLRPGRTGEVRIYNSLGQTIRTWVFSAAGQGGQILTWDLRDSQERAVAPGTYYMQLRVGGMAETRMVKLIH